MFKTNEEKLVQFGLQGSIIPLLCFGWEVTREGQGKVFPSEILSPLLITNPPLAGLTKKGLFRLLWLCMAIPFWPAMDPAFKPSSPPARAPSSPSLILALIWDTTSALAG